MPKVFLKTHGCRMNERDMPEQKAIGKMGMLSRLRAKKPEMVFGFLGGMALSRGEELVRDIRGV